MSRKEPVIVSLNEMYDILSSEMYDDFRREHRVGVKWLPDGSGVVRESLLAISEYSPQFYRHIVAEQLLAEDYHDVDWKEYLAWDARIFFDLIELWMHPYVWCDVPSLNTMIAEGRVAKEEYYLYRRGDVVDRFRYIEEYYALEFANHPSASNDRPEAGYIEGMHDWRLLTWDIEELQFKAVDEDTHITREEINSVKRYDGASLRTRLLMIAEKMGGAKSAELLRMLQTEWPLIKRWKPGLDTMTKEDIVQFEDILFNGFNDLLAKWEVQPKEEKEDVQTESSRFCKYINVVRFAEAYKGQSYTIEDYENTLHEASKGTAKSFANVLMNGLKAGFLDFHGDDKKAILAYFQQHFPDMKKYSYQNFSDVMSL